MTRWRRLGLVVGLIALASVSLLGATASVTAMTYANRVLPRTLVAGVSLGGLSSTRAEAAVTGIVADSKEIEIPVTLLGETQSFPVKELGVTVDAGQTLQQVTHEDNRWDWVSWRYWSSFFRLKKLPPSYTIDSAVLNKKILDSFKVSSQPVDAGLQVANGQLEVIPSKVGQSFDELVAVSAIKQSLVSGQAATMALQTKPSDPAVTTDVAAGTKADIEQTFKPMTLSSGDTSYILTVGDQYGSLDFSAANGKLSWQVSDSKLGDLIKIKIARKVNTKMVQRVITAGTNEVTTAGSEGREVNVAELTQTVKRTITERTGTPTSTILIPVKQVAITERVSYPSFVAGLFPGKYIDVNLSEQRMYLVDNNTKLAEYVVSTGKWSMPTPKGVLYIVTKNSLGFSKKYTLWMPWWNGLAPSPDGTGYLGYGIHELPCFNSSCSRQEVGDHLGTPISHGCIRLGVGNAKTVYDWAPTGTPVNIH